MNNKRRKNVLKHITNSNWASAIKLLLKELNDFPCDCWVLGRLSRCYLNENNCKNALLYAKKASIYSPSNPLVLWDLAEALYINEQFRDSCLKYKKILDSNLSSCAKQMNYPESWIKTFHNACRVKIANCYLQLDRLAFAIHWYESYLHNIRRGAKNAYSIRDIKKILGRIKSLREKKASGEPLTWISLIEFTPNNKQASFAGGFTHGLVSAKTKNVALKLFKTELEQMGYKINHFEDVEEFERRLLKTTVDEELLVLEKKLRKNTGPVFSTFFVYPSKK